MKTRGLVLSLLMIASVAALSAYYVGSVPVELADDAKWGEQVAFWKGAIERDGGSEAYASFAAHVATRNYGSQHQAAHAFGSALFAAEGQDGIAVCDQRFSFGCFHQFLGDAIQAMGLESVVSLNQKCFERLADNPLACQHGIGHGVLAAVGYDDASLKQSLDICRDLPGADPIGGCYGGVFMEYNMRTMLADAGEAREYKGDPFAPCGAFEAPFRGPCIYWQPQWWANHVFAVLTREEAFSRMGELCNSFANSKGIRRSCFEGIGSTVEEESDRNPDFAAKLCDAVSLNATDRLFCRSIGANHFGLDVSAEAGVRVCDGLTGARQEYCLAHARNELNIAIVREPPL